ncbi:MAG: hypothetical protein C5B51_01250 [Terriglobia bacterium]|nr:MAG: hypothetical protein C5B51_01250 [Terriglobia bacterium]
MPLMLPSPGSSVRSRVPPVNLLRRQALERLYRRRETVENLIRSLEDYQRLKTADRPCVDISAARKCS